MSRLKKRWMLFCLIFAAVLVCSGALSLTTKAGQTKLSLAVPNSVKLNDTFTVTLQVESDRALAGIDARVLYNPELVSFIGNEEGRITGAEGVININDAFAAETKTKTYALTFAATALGEAAFSFDETYVMDYANLNDFEVATAGAKTTVKENKKLARDADLAELIIGNGELNTPFDSDVTEYQVTVSGDQNMLIYSSVPSAEDAVVTVEEPETLTAGVNDIRITVTAPSGETKTYTLHVVKGE